METVTFIAISVYKLFVVTLAFSKKYITIFLKIVEAWCKWWANAKLMLHQSQLPVQKVFKFFCCVSSIAQSLLIVK